MLTLVVRSTKKIYSALTSFSNTNFPVFVMRKTSNGFQYLNLNTLTNPAFPEHMTNCTCVLVTIPIVTLNYVSIKLIAVHFSLTKISNTLLNFKIFFRIIKHILNMD